MKTLRLIVLLTSLFFGGASLALGAMSSSSYRIPSDAVDVGGVPQTSASFFSEDTISEIATGDSESASYRLKAGYQTMQAVYLAISSPSDITMAPTIPGVSGGAGNGEAAWTVITDNLAGYSLYVRSAESPALKNTVTPAYVFADYTPAGAPDYDWSIAAGASEFGFTPEGSDIVQKFKDNSTNCNTGTFDTPDACWYNFISTNPGELVAQSSAANHPSGVSTKIKVQAQSHASHLQEEGTYEATITVTALAN